MARQRHGRRRRISHPNPPAPFPSKLRKGELGRAHLNRSWRISPRKSQMPAPKLPFPSSLGQGAGGWGEKVVNEGKTVTHTERAIYGDIKERARSMRANPTVAEDKLWQRIRKKQVLGFRFRRQYAIGPYIVDFCCIAAKLVIEIDGAIHDDPGHAEYDLESQQYLESVGLRVLRFSTSQVIDRPDSVLKAINDYLAPLR